MFAYTVYRPFAYCIQSKKTKYCIPKGVGCHPHSIDLSTFETIDLDLLSIVKWSTQYRTLDLDYMNKLITILPTFYLSFLTVFTKVYPADPF